jgi:prevent-host-death family protein
MATVNMHEAKTHLSKLVAKAQSGEETIIALAGKPAAKLVPFEEKKPKRLSRLGFMQGLGYTMPKDIKTPFKKEIEEMFYGNPDKFKVKRT